MDGILGQIVKAGSLGFLRHAAGAGGAALVAHGLMTQSQDQQFVGAMATLGALGFSVYDKWKAQKDKQAAVAAAAAPQPVP